MSTTPVHVITTRKIVELLLAAGGLVLLGLLLGPASPAAAATQTFDLYAEATTTSLPGGQSVPAWRYRLAADLPGDPALARPGGPVLEVTQGDTVNVTLHNNLGERTALLFQGQPVPPDRDGVANGGTKQYTFVASQPGTYLYEAGLLPNAEHQNAMGLYGALVVRPTTAGRAYASASTSYDDEAVLVLSELDPALNDSANKAAFDMRKYAPRYSLINGRAYPDTAAVPTTGGNRVLLRYVNAGIIYHSMGVLGAEQSLLAVDGSPLSHAGHYVADTFGPGQTADTLVAAPTSTARTTLSVYDSSLTLHNTSSAGMGGMMTAITSPGSGGGLDTGPVTSAVAYDAGTLTATVDNAARGGDGVAAAEYYVDSVDGAGTAMSAVGSFGSPGVDVTASVANRPGEYVVYVRGQDSGGHWGPFSSVLVTGTDPGGPTTREPGLTPNLTNHSSTGVAVTATADDTSSGNAAIQAAEFFIDTVGADESGTHMTVNKAAPIASIDGTIGAATVNALTEGSHVVFIHAQDAGGSWGEPVSVILDVDTTGPTTSGVSVDPNPNNGNQAYPSGATNMARLSATTMTDPVSNSLSSTIKRAEAFIDTVGADGSGIPLVPSDGVFDGQSEGGYADIPLATIKALSQGSHTLSVHARDAAGNWGATSTTTLVIDKTAPTVSGLSVSPTPTRGASAVTVTATAADALAGVNAAEWFIAPDPGLGSATPLSVSGSGPWTVTGAIDVTALPEGTTTVRVRVRDAAGNWSAVSTVPVQVSRPLSFSTLGNSNPPGVGGSADDADIYSWSGTAFSRSLDLSAAPYNLPAAANVDGFDRENTTTFAVSFSGTSTTVPGLGAVQDEDVIRWNGSAWSVAFDGTSHGLTTDALDIDDFTLSGTSVYFTTVGNTNPPGVTGTADNSDIYLWNGTSYSRVWDATTNGVPASANVDGLNVVSPTDFQLSFDANSTTVTGLGAVQDEDVVVRYGGAWRLYFDGTARGLTAANHDIDALDIP